MGEQFGRITRRRFLQGAAAAGVIASVPGLFPAPANAASFPFIKRSGTSLWEGRRPWYLYGASIYGTSNSGGANSGNVAGIVGLARQAGLNTLRIVNFFEEGNLTTPTDPTVAPFRESDWRRVDEILAAARSEGMRAILDLSAFRNCLGAWLYRRWQDGLGPQMSPYHPDAQPFWTDFIRFVTGRVNTQNGLVYRNDATIAIVSFAGEPEPPASGEPLKTASTQELTDFYSAVFAMWRRSDRKHLLSSGGLLHIDWEELYGTPGGSGIDIDAIVALRHHDVPSIHNYWVFDPPTATNDYKTPKFSRACAGVGKPWITEEFGWKQSVADADRADRYQLVYDIQANPDPSPPVGVAPGVASAGIAVWNLGTEVHPDSHDVNPDTPLAWQALIDNAP